MRSLYSLLFYLLLPLILLRLWWRGFKSPAYRERISERLGDVSLNDDKPVIWLHAVSVGETMAAKPLIDAMLTEFPNHQLLVTNTTPTGSAQCRRLYPDTVQNSYFPYDVPHAIERFLDAVKPEIVIVMETELWPNLYHQCDLRGIPVLVANARLSEKSLNGYKKISSLVKPLLQSVSYLAAQSETDLQRFQLLGVPTEKSGVAGNLKYQMSIPENCLSAAANIKNQIGERPVWIAASTHQGEDHKLLSIHQQLLAEFPNLLLLIVPRHPERFSDVASLCRATGLGVKQRSQNEFPDVSDAIWLIDTMGELLTFYALAEFAFVGGSLVPTGGHNPLEPAALERACITGPHTFNFKDVMTTMLAANAIVQIENQDELKKVVQEWLQQPELAREKGRAAHLLLKQNQGAVEFLTQQIKKLMAP